MQELMGLRAELVQHRRILRNVGGNLNDVARHANSTSEVHMATARVEALVARVVEKVGLAVGHVDGLAMTARRALLRGRPSGDHEACGHDQPIPTG